MKFPEEFRWVNAAKGFETKPGDPYGVFVIPSAKANGRRLCVIADDGTKTGWEHVSVSMDDPKKCASWTEMCIVKGMFWDEEECVVQYHPAKKDYVNLHPGVLHLWRRRGVLEFAMPPMVCV